MSVAYQSWEMGSGPTVGYKMHHSGSTPGDGLNFTTRDAIPRGITALIYRQSQQHQQQQQQQQQQQAQHQDHNVVKLMNGSSQVQQRFAIATVPISASGREESSTRSTLSATATAVVVAPPSSTVGPPPTQLSMLASTSTPAPTINTNTKNVVVPCSSSSSSIVTSSISAGDGDGDGDDTSDESEDKEVQSEYKGPLEQMDTLMTTLPIRRGLSKFYNGRSRSFTSLAEVKSIKDLAKPENPYAKRRRAPGSGRREGLDRHRFPPPRTTAAGIAKKPTGSSNGTTLTLAVAMSSLESEENSSSRWQKSNRSFSLTDLQKA